MEDDDGREINGNKERLYDWSGASMPCVDQVALPEPTAELLTLAQHQSVAEVKKGAS